MHFQKKTLKNTITLCTENMSSKKGTVKSIKNQSSLEHITNVVWFQNILFSDLTLSVRRSVTDYGIWNARRKLWSFQVYKKRHGILKSRYSFWNQPFKCLFQSQFLLVSNDYQRKSSCYERKLSPPAQLRL